MSEFLIILGVAMAIFCAVACIIEDEPAFLIGVAIGLVLLLLGIVSVPEEPTYLEDYKAKATQEEVIILETINDNKFNGCTVKGEPLREAIYNRTSKATDGKPFSDMESVVKFYDNSLSCTNERKVTTIQELYKQVYHKELFEGGSDIAVEEGKLEIIEPSVTPTEEQINEQIVDSTVTLKNKTLLSPEKVRELTLSAKQCNRAKVSLLSLTENGRYLTVDDYESVTKLILDCENLMMQVELNK